MSTNANRTRGRAAKAAGDAFEAWVETQHDMAKYLGVLLTVQHNQPAVQHVGGRLVYSKKSACDYTGLVSDGTGAKMLSVEAKSTKGRLMRSAIQPKQAEQLDAVAKAGHAVYLLVEFRNAGRCRRFAIPWFSVPWKKLRSSDSIGVEDIDPSFEIRPGECYLKPGVQVPTGAGGRRRVFPRD